MSKQQNCNSPYCKPKEAAKFLSDIYGLTKEEVMQLRKEFVHDEANFEEEDDDCAIGGIV